VLLGEESCKIHLWGENLHLTELSSKLKKKQQQQQKTNKKSYFSTECFIFRIAETMFKGI